MVEEGENSNDEDVNVRVRRLENELLRTREELRRREDEARGNPPRKECTFKSFLSCKPSYFEGSNNPTDALNWIREVEQAFRACQCGNELKVNYATMLLRGKAGHWWDTVCATTPQATIEKLSWEQFVEKLKKEYCSKGDLNRIEREFLTMKKGDSRIEDHADKFVERLRFLPKWANDDETAVNRFTETLPSEYQLLVGQAPNLGAAIQIAKKSARDRGFEESGVKAHW